MKVFVQRAMPPRFWEYRLGRSKVYWSATTTVATDGGHRRISLKSIQEYQHRHNLHPNALMHGEARIKVVVVEDDEPTRLMLQTNFDRWGLPLDVTMYASAIEALLDMHTVYP
jgi:hypothetical protein